MLVVLARESIEEVYLELVLSIVGVVEDIASCTDDKLSMASMVNDDKGI